MQSRAAALGILLVVCASAAPLSHPVPPLSRQPAPDPDAQVRAIAARPEIRRAIAIVRELETVAEPELVALTEIAAPPFQEAARAARLRRADHWGRTRRCRRGRGRERARPETRFRGWRDGGDRGASGHGVSTGARMSRSVAKGTGCTRPASEITRGGSFLLLNVARALVRADVRTVADILFVGSVGEEGLGDLRGVRHLLGADWASGRPVHRD